MVSAVKVSFLAEGAVGRAPRNVPCPQDEVGNTAAAQQQPAHRFASRAAWNLSDPPSTPPRALLVGRAGRLFPALDHARPPQRVGSVAIEADAHRSARP